MAAGALLLPLLHVLLLSAATLDEQLLLGMGSGAVTAAVTAASSVELDARKHSPGLLSSTLAVSSGA